jgi:peptide/nickel transport system permease protein
MSLEFLQMLGAALIIENVFALPGYGSFAFNASLQGDIPVILGITAFGTLLVIVVNLITDLANGWLNPKARVR